MLVNQYSGTLSCGKVAHGWDSINCNIRIVQVFQDRWAVSQDTILTTTIEMLANTLAETEYPLDILRATIGAHVNVNHINHVNSVHKSSFIIITEEYNAICITLLVLISLWFIIPSRL